LKKGTIREVIAKLIHDPNIDPAEYSVIFRDSDVLRRVPFTYLEFVEGGFYYFGNFYPLYKIMAIINDESREYLLRRNISGMRVIGDKGIDLPDYPIYLRAIYDDFILHRYASHILFSLRSRLHDKDVLEWFKALGEFEIFKFGDYTAYIIKEPGPFRGVSLFVSNDDEKKMLRSIPTPLNIDDITSRIRNHKICTKKIMGDIEHIFLLNDDCLCIKNNSFIERCNSDHEDLINKLNEDLSIFIDKKGDTKHLIAVCDQKEFRFLKPKEEAAIAKIVGLDSSSLDYYIRLRNTVISKNELVKIHDRDIIFAIRGDGSVSRGANLIP